MFPDTLDGAKVLFFSSKDDYGNLCDTEGNIVAHFKYLAICKYDNTEGYYLFKCSEKYDIESDYLWDSIETCMNVASDLYDNRIVWTENK